MRKGRILIRLTSYAGPRASWGFYIFISSAVDSLESDVHNIYTTSS